MTFEPGDPGASPARDSRAPGPHGLDQAAQLAIAESGAVAADLREGLDAARAATRTALEAAETLVADHGRTLVRLERAQSAARRTSPLPPGPPADRGDGTAGDGDGVLLRG